MKRTTIVLTDELAMLLERERRRRGVSATEVVREALDGYFGHGAAPLAIAGLGRSGQEQTAVDVESIVAREWTYPRLMGLAEQEPVSGNQGEVDEHPISGPGPDGGQTTAP